MDIFEKGIVVLGVLVLIALLKYLSLVPILLTVGAMLFAPQ